MSRYILSHVFLILVIAVCHLYVVDGHLTVSNCTRPFHGLYIIHVLSIGYILYMYIAWFILILHIDFQCLIY